MERNIKKKMIKRRCEGFEKFENEFRKEVWGGVVIIEVE